MKKLLSILSSITIIISTAATVIACAPSNNEILEKTESHKNFLLLRDISKIINKKIIQWMKQNAEYIKGDNLELDFLKNIFDKTEKEDFPIEIKPVDFKKTIESINLKAKDVLFEISKEISKYDQFSHLFINLDPEQIIKKINFKNFYMQNFNLAQSVLERKHIEGWEDMLIKAETIDKSFNLFVNFNITFSYMENNTLYEYSTQDSMANLYLTEDVELFEEVMIWLQQDLPDVWEIIKNYGLTFEGHKGIESFSSVEKLYDENGDIIKIAKISSMEDGSNPDIEKFNIINVDYSSTIFSYSDPVKSQTNSFLYDESFIKANLPYDSPDDDLRYKPILNNSSLMSNLVNYNNFKGENAYWLEGSDGDISFDFGTKESFIEVGLYGNILNAQDLVDSRNGDGVLWGKIPGILSYDREYNINYQYKWEDKTYSTGNGLQEKYHQPLLEFYENKNDFKFINENVKDRLNVQKNYKIESGSDEGVFTQTNLVDGGQTSINFWTYDNLPLPNVDNIATFIMTEKNKTLNDSYRDVLSYAYDIIIEKQNENGFATSIMSNVFRNSTIYYSLFYRMGLYLDKNFRQGTNSIILKDKDFQVASENPKKPSKVIDAIFTQQKNKIDKMHSWIPKTYMVSFGSDSYLDIKGITKFQSEYNNVLYMKNNSLDRVNPNWYEKASNPLENIIIYIGGIGFPIHNYNTYKNNKQELARWNYGTTNFTFVNETKNAKAKYSGYIF